MNFLNLKDYAEDISLFEKYVPVRTHSSITQSDDVVDYLLGQVEHLLSRFSDLKAQTYAEKRKLLHAAINVLAPNSFGNEQIAKLDCLLQAELRQRTLLDGAALSQSSKLEIKGTKITVWQGDITTIKIDAIVNAANDRLLGCFQPLHRCIDNAIHSRAGVQLRDDCFTIMQKQNRPEPTGTAKVTRAYNLPSRFVIHTVGPIVQGALTDLHTKKLRKSYLNCLDLCAAMSPINHIAFCCISTGVFGYPPEQAAAAALNTVCDWLNENPTQLEYVIFNVFSDRDRRIYEKLIAASDK